MAKSKLLKTYEIFDFYEKRFAKAAAEKPFVLPVSDEEKSAVIEKTKRMLGFDESLIPEIKGIDVLATDDFETFTVSQIKYETWKNVYGCATLYLPKKEGKLPLAFLLCGHGDLGRLTHGYHLMALDLMLGGVAVIVPDNIGQGDRSFMGHWDSIGPFYAGLTLQGLIVMETVALVRYMKGDERFDSEKFAALGNSGGGTLTLMLAALCPELSVLASSGYPSEFHYVLEKERPHCSCNLLRGCANSPEMWEIYSVFAPKPLLIEQGIFDNLIAVEYFERSARKIRGTYSLMDAEENFESAVAHTKHPWDKDDRDIITDFIFRRLGIDRKNENAIATDSLPSLSIEGWHVTLPADAIDTDTLSERLSGRKMPKETKLQDIFKPLFNGKPVDESEIISDLGRGPVMRVFAQMECALTTPDDKA